MPLARAESKRVGRSVDQALKRGAEEGGSERDATSAYRANVECRPNKPLPSRPNVVMHLLYANFVPHASPPSVLSIRRGNLLLRSTFSRPRPRPSVCPSIRSEVPPQPPRRKINGTLGIIYGKRRKKLGRKAAGWPALSPAVSLQRLVIIINEGS